MLLDTFSCAFLFGALPILAHLSDSWLYSPQLESTKLPIKDWRKSRKVFTSDLQSVLAISLPKHSTRPTYSLKTEGVQLSGH